MKIQMNFPEAPPVTHGSTHCEPVDLTSIVLIPVTLPVRKIIAVLESAMSINTALKKVNLTLGLHRLVLANAKPYHWRRSRN